MTYEKKKIKICDYDGRKIDSATITDEKGLKKKLKEWKLKGVI